MRKAIYDIITAVNKQEPKKTDGHRHTLSDTQTLLHAYLRMYVRAYLPKRIYTYMDACMQETYACIHAFMYICTLEYMHACIQRFWKVSERRRVCDLLH